MAQSKDSKPPYDLESVYDEQIFPLMKEIIGICREHKLPMFATFQYGVSADDEQHHCSTFLPFEADRPLAIGFRELPATLKRNGALFAAFTMTSDKGKD